MDCASSYWEPNFGFQIDGGCEEACRGGIIVETIVVGTFGFLFPSCSGAIYGDV